MPSKKPGKITFKGKIDPGLIPGDAAPRCEIVDAKVTERLSKFGFQVAESLSLRFSWYPTLEAASPNSVGHSRIGDLD